MDDFIKWLCDDASGLVQMVALIATVVSLAALIVFSMILLATGYYLPPLVVWILFPALFVIREYRKEKNKNG